jgi:5-formyltetrahydrofolate cyclo-ligase
MTGDGPSRGRGEAATSGDASAQAPDAKRALRATLRRRRAAMSDAARAAESLAIAEAVIARIGGEPSAVGGAVFCYVGVGAEVSTGPLLERWTRSGVEVWVPRMADDGAMSAVLLDSLDGLVAGAWGVPTCLTGTVMHGVPAWVVVPCVGVTRRGDRLGQGGGHYDRYLATRAAAGRRPRTVALAFEAQVVEALPTEPHDRPVDAVCTPGGWIEA